MAKNSDPAAKTIREQIDADKAADKRLADAAPEMLEALKWAEKVISMNIPENAPEYTGRNKSLEAIRSVIAKAEGK